MAVLMILALASISQPPWKNAPLLASWLVAFWSGPLLLVFVGVPLVIIVIYHWPQLLDWPPGKRWQIPAAIMPALIPIARSLEENAPSWVRGLTLATLLVAIAVLQNYGQDRNNRDRIKTENRITEQTNLLEEQRDLLIAAINEAEKGREEAERRAERTDALLVRIADGISAAAASAKEAREEEE
jgi:hypothetical protein